MDREELDEQGRAELEAGLRCASCRGRIREGRTYVSVIAHTGLVLPGAPLEQQQANATMAITQVCGKPACIEAGEATGSQVWQPTTNVWVDELEAVEEVAEQNGNGELGGGT